MCGQNVEFFSVKPVCIERPGYGMDNEGFESRKKQEIFLSTKIPNRLYGLPSLLSSRYRVLSLDEKQSGREINHSLSSNAEVKNEWSFTCAPLIRLHALDREFFFL